MNKDSLFKAIEGGVTSVVHVANPLPGATKLSEEEMIVPAREGMKAILEACV